MSSSSPESAHVVDGSNAGKPPYCGSFSEKFHSYLSLEVTFHSGQDKDEFLRNEQEIPVADMRTEISLTFFIDNTDAGLVKLLRWKGRLSGDSRVKEVSASVTSIHTSTTTIKIS